MTTCRAYDCHLNKDGTCSSSLEAKTCGSRMAYMETNAYDPKFGDDRMCMCGHAYYRHFDTYEHMRPVGCKYCGCPTFKEGPLCQHTNTVLKKVNKESVADSMYVDYQCGTCDAIISTSILPKDYAPSEASFKELIEVSKRNGSRLYIHSRPFIEE